MVPMQLHMGGGGAPYRSRPARGLFPAALTLLVPFVVLSVRKPGTFALQSGVKLAQQRVASSRLGRVPVPLSRWGWGLRLRRGRRKTNSRIDMEDLWERVPEEWKKLPKHFRQELEENLKDPEDFRKRIDTENRIIRRRNKAHDSTFLQRGQLLVYSAPKPDTVRRELESGLDQFSTSSLINGREVPHPQYYDKSVLLLVHHTDQGSVGLLLNRLTQFKMGEVTKAGQLSVFDQSNLFLGGDMGKGALTVLHDVPGIQGAVEIKPGIFLGGDAKAIEESVRDNRSNASDFKWIINQSGWKAGQLEKEIDLGWWRNIDATNDLIISKNGSSPAHLWRELQIELGDENDRTRNDSQNGQL